MGDESIERAVSMIPIQEFKFDRDTTEHMTACSFAVIGSSKSGKTTFLKYLLKTAFAEDVKVLFTQSLHNDIYTGMKKEMAVCPGYAPDVIREMYKINKATKNHYPFLCIVDDLVGAKNDAQMMKLLALYRNSNMSAIVVGQDAYMLNPTGRANVNHSVLFYQNTDGRCEDTVKQFLRSYFPRFLNMEQKIELYKRLTEDHCFLWINNLDNTIIRCRLTDAQIAESH